MTLRSAPLAIAVATVMLLAGGGNALAATQVGAVAPSGTSNVSGYNNVLDYQGNSGTVSYEAPNSGVITAFSIRTGGAILPSDTVALAIERGKPFMPGAVLQSVAGSHGITGPLDSVITYSERVPVVAGDRLGMILTSVAGGTAPYFSFTPFYGGDEIFEFAPAPAVGSNIGTSGPGMMTHTGFHLNLAANLEPDADNDGYGDDTQDQCPADAARQGPCANSAPVVSSFTLTNKRFRIDKQIAALISRAPRGTTVNLSLSETASVNFSLLKRTAGRKVKGKCKRKTRRNRHAHRCTREVPVFGFARRLTAGENSLAFGGRYVKGGNTRRLAPGSYTMTATPTDTSAMVGKTVKLTFRVVR